MHWPQITMIVIMTVGAAYTLAHHGKPRSLHNFWSKAIGIGIYAGILTAGGFWG